MRTKRRLLVYILATLAITRLTAFAAPPIANVSIQPANVVVGIGQTFSLNISIANVINLYAYQFTVNFNPGVLSANSMSEGPLLKSGGTTFFDGGTINNSTGTISFTFDTMLGAGPGVNGSGVLTTANFTSLASGMTAITLSDVLFLDANFNTIPVTVSGGSVNVQAVPDESSAIFLLGIGLTGLALVFRKHRRLS